MDIQEYNSHIISEYLTEKKDAVPHNTYRKMFIKEKMLIKATCDDGTTYTGKIYKLVIQLCEDDNNKPHALLFISQDKRYVEQDGEFGCASVWVDKLKSIDIL